MTTNQYNPIQLVKRRLFAMRNGVVADILRKGGCPHSIIFGVNLPQLAEIAQEIGKDKQLSLQLWNNCSTRESMLLAPMLMPVDDFTQDEAMQWISQITYPEVADVLCLKLLRHEPYALELANKLMGSDDDNMRYCGVRLMCNLAPQHKEIAIEAGKKELSRDCNLTRQAALILISYDDETL